MEWTTAEGRSYEEAVAALLKSMGADRSEVEIEDLGDTKKLFGLGGTVAKVRGRLLEESFGESPANHRPRTNGSAPKTFAAKPSASKSAAADALGDIPEKMRAFLEDIVEKMNIKDAGVEILSSEGQIVLNVTGVEGGILTGKNGETLDALQTLVEIYAGRLNGSKFPFVVDAENYRQHREEKLRALAEKSAEKAVKTGRKVFLGPMKPAERKTIHAFLQNDTRVKTHSQGTGDNRQVVIHPEK